MQKDNKNDRLRALWESSSANVDERGMAEALGVFRDNRRAYISKRSKRRVLLAVMKYAAIVAAPLVAALVAWNYSAQYYAEENALVERYVPDGMIDSLLLSDNTKVILNAGTSIIYPARFNSHNLNRNVYVTGNCHFAVAKDRLHPFIVNMGNLKVKVLGTHFSVKSYNEDDRIVVTLEEGLVKAFDSRHSMLLLPNEQLVYYRKDGRMTKSRVDAVAYNSWTSGNIDFAGRPLADILKTLERHYNVKFHVAPGIDTGKRYTMNFKRNEPIDKVMEVLVLTSGNIRYTRNGNDIRLY